MTSQQHEAIMVVDDEKDILSVISRALEQSGMKVYGFNSPVSALKHVHRDGCNDCWLLLSDVRMPEMSGFEFVKKVKLMLPELVVLLMSSFQINNEEFEKALPSTEVDGFIQKPASMSQIVETIKRYESIRQKT